jgi:hypothetical protein
MRGFRGSSSAIVLQYGKGDHGKERAARDRVISRPSLLPQFSESLRRFEEPSEAVFAHLQRPGKQFNGSMMSRANPAVFSSLREVDREQLFRRFIFSL